MLFDFQVYVRECMFYILHLTIGHSTLLHSTCYFFQRVYILTFNIQLYGVQVTKCFNLANFVKTG